MPFDEHYGKGHSCSTSGRTANQWKAFHSNKMRESRECPKKRRARRSACS